MGNTHSVGGDIDSSCGRLRGRCPGKPRDTICAYVHASGFGAIRRSLCHKVLHWAKCCQTKIHIHRCKLFQHIGG
jgi:hypothetical protein